MKLGFQIALFVLCLNLVSGLWYKLQVAGYNYSNPVTGAGEAEDYTDRFDPDKVMNQTQTNVITWLPFLGNIVVGLQMLWDAVGFIFAGFPALLFSYGSAIGDPSARAAYELFCGVIGAVTSFITVLWIIQIFSGRQVQD